MVYFRVKPGAGDLKDHPVLKEDGIEEAQKRLNHEYSVLCDMAGVFTSGNYDRKRFHVEMRKHMGDLIHEVYDENGKSFMCIVDEGGGEYVSDLFDRSVDWPYKPLTTNQEIEEWIALIGMAVRMLS